MKSNIRILMGIIQAERFIPEIKKACKRKNVSIENYKFDRVSFFEGRLTGDLIGEPHDVGFILGIIEGYGIGFKLNKPEPKKVAPTR